MWNTQLRYQRKRKLFRVCLLVQHCLCIVAKYDYPYTNASTSFNTTQSEKITSPFVNEGVNHELINKPSKTPSRSAVLSGTHIPAFQHTPSWISDTHFSHHFAMERQKAIMKELKFRKEKATLDHKWCDMIKQSLIETDTVGESEGFILNYRENCADTASDDQWNPSDNVTSDITHALLREKPEDHLTSPTEQDVTPYRRFQWVDTLLAKEHMMNSFHQSTKARNTTVGFDIDPYEHDYTLHVERPNWSVKARNAQKSGITSLEGGYGPLQLSATTSALNEELDVGIGFDKYGLFVDRSVQGRATAVGFFSPKVEGTTLADFKDHQYGQRLRLGKFEIALRHDFNEFEEPDASEYSTEVLVGYDDVGVMVASDVKEKAHGVGVHIRGHQIALLHDFDDHTSSFSSTSKNGLKFVMGYDLPDSKSRAASAEVGIGLPHAMFVKIGAGMTSDGLPQASLQVNSGKSHVGVSLENKNNASVINYSVRLRGSSLSQQFSLDPSKLRLPNVLGLTPSHITDLVNQILSPLPSSNPKPPLKTKRP